MRFAWKLLGELIGEQQEHEWRSAEEVMVCFYRYELKKKALLNFLHQTLSKKIVVAYKSTVCLTS